MAEEKKDMKVTDIDMGSKFDPQYVKITENRPSDGATSVIMGNTRNEDTLKIDSDNHRHNIVKEDGEFISKDKGDWRKSS